MGLENIIYYRKIKRRWRYMPLNYAFTIMKRYNSKEITPVYDWTD